VKKTGVRKTIELSAPNHNLDNFYEAIGYTKEDMESMEDIIVTIINQSNTLSEVLEAAIVELEGKDLLLAILTIGRLIEASRYDTPFGRRPFYGI